MREEALGVAAAEMAEAHALRAALSAAPRAAADRIGLAVTEVGGALVVVAPGAAVGFWTRVLGLGVHEPITATLIGEVLEVVARHGGTHTWMQIAPALLPPDWDDIRAAHGLTAGPSWYKLGRTLDEPINAGPTALSVARTAPAEADATATVLARGFSWDEAEMRELYGSALAAGRLDGFPARAGDGVVAAGTLGVHGTHASMYGGATLPAHRGRGAQGALLTARLREAARRGCTAAFAETWIPAGGQRNPSYDNMLRSGFSLLYERPSWHWRA